MAEAAAKKADPKAEGPAAQPQAAPKKFDFLNLIILLLVTVNLCVVGGMGFFMQKMWGRIQNLQVETQRLAEPKEEVQKESPAGKELEAKNIGVLYPLESFLVNIASDQGPKFLQTSMEFELADSSVEEEIARKKPAIRDTIIIMLSSRNYKELRDPAGMKKLREDILRAVNNLLSVGKIKEIYFTQFHFN